MRLHRLRMRAFGPYADETIIDFDDLSGDGLFLLHGATGAGKTTILDAVAFALYGRVPGVRHDAKRLHSDHAAPEVVPEVELDTTINGCRLRITRSPEFERPKRRGTGFTTSNAKASLVWLDGSGVNLTRIPEIGDAILELLGMSAEQFFQVVLLPQGDFARFLRANPDERESLLERIFDTERFGDMENWLRDGASASGTKLTEHTTSLDGLARQIVAVGGAQPPAEPDFEWALSCLESARSVVETAQERQTTSRARLDRAQTAHSAAQRTAEFRGRGERAHVKLAKLDAASTELATAQRLLDDARRAAPIVPIIEDHEAAVAAEKTAAEVRDRAEAALSGLPEGEAVCADRAEGAIARAIETWTEESGRLQPLAERAAARGSLIGEIDSLDTRVAASAARIAELEALVEQLPGRRAAIADDVRAGTESKAMLPGLLAERQVIDGLVTALADRIDASEAVTATAQRRNDAREQHYSAREHLLDLRDRRINGMAAELAGRLVDGEACVVCGSVDHPKPAVGEESSVSDADENRASKAERTAGATLEKATNEHAAAEKVLAAIDAKLDGASADDVERRRAENGDKLAAAQRRAESLDALRAQLAAIDVEEQEWRKELSEKGAERSAMGERAAGLRAELAELDAQIAEVTGGRFTVEGRRDELGSLCRLADKVRIARDEESRALTRRRDVEDRLVSRCAEAGLGDVAAARKAVASPSQIAAWESALKQAGEIRAACEATLSEADVRAALAADPADLVELETELTEATTEHDAASREHAVRAKALVDTERFVTEFGEEFEALGPLRARHAELQGLAALVSGRGQNSRRMSLRSYVLAARLEEVLVAASSRLRQMSSGRYEFVHTDAAGPRGRTGGLGIEVRDEYTGKTRPTTTLSGGETFFASLALALGLADVVAAESGGRLLDTIVIDEGFGTLDPETLDLVMGVLDELRSGGRVVGIVSHVDELRVRIPAQLQVIRGENGSTVRMRAPVGA